MRTTASGVPLASLLLSVAFGAVTFLSTFVGDGEVFYWMFQVCLFFSAAALSPALLIVHV